VSQRTTTVLFAVLALAMAVAPARTQGQQAQGDEIGRRAKVKVAPVYPDLARKMKITGTVKLEIVVLPNGTVKDAHVVGGHPVLASAALDAVKKWRFEPSATESTGIIDFKFGPQ
jgi:TonB family protein